MRGAAVDRGLGLSRGGDSLGRHWRGLRPCLCERPPSAGGGGSSGVVRVARSSRPSNRLPVPYVRRRVLHAVGKVAPILSSTPALPLPFSPLNPHTAVLPSTHPPTSTPLYHSSPLRAHSILLPPSTVGHHSTPLTPSPSSPPSPEAAAVLLALSAPPLPRLARLSSPSTPSNAA